MKTKKASQVNLIELKEFAADFHNFTTKWPTYRISEALHETKQATYKRAQNKKKEANK